MPPNDCSVSLSDNLENMGVTLIIINNFPLFTGPVHVVFFGNELAFFCDKHN